MKSGPPCHTDPGGDRNTPEKIVSLIKITYEPAIHRPFTAVAFKTNPRQCQRSGTLNRSDNIFKPLNAHHVLWPSRVLAQRKQRPHCRNHQGLARNSVDSRIPTIPATARAHTVVEHRFCEFPPAIRLGGQVFLGAFGKRNERKRCGLDPTAGPRSPAPPTVGVVLG